MIEGLQNGLMMGKTDIRGLYLLEKAINNFPNESYKDIDIQKSLDQYEIYRKETGFDEIYGDSDRSLNITENKVLHVFENRKFELALFNSKDIAITSATINGGGFKTFLDGKQIEELFVVQSIEIK